MNINYYFLETVIETSAKHFIARQERFGPTQFLRPLFFTVHFALFQQYVLLILEFNICMKQRTEITSNPSCELLFALVLHLFTTLTI